MQLHLYYMLICSSRQIRHRSLTYTLPYKHTTVLLLHKHHQQGFLQKQTKARGSKATNSHSPRGNPSLWQCSRHGLSAQWKVVYVLLNTLQVSPASDPAVKTRTPFCLAASNKEQKYRTPRNRCILRIIISGKAYQEATGVA